MFECAVLYKLIQSCNRSTPHMVLVRHCLDCLLNIARYKSTTAAVFAQPGTNPIQRCLRLPLWLSSV